MLDQSFSERLSTFAIQLNDKGVPTDVLHEAKRLLLNQLKASVGATQTETIALLKKATEKSESKKNIAHILWSGEKVTPESAALVNGALFEVLDFHDTYIPCFMHATSAILPAVLALGEAQKKPGIEILKSLAIGIEVELAVASILMPTAYFRGYVPAGLTGGVGAAVSCGILRNLNHKEMTNAIGVAMCSAFGLYVSVGSMTLSYITGATAQSGMKAAELAELGFDAPRTAFEGDKGMLLTHSDEKREKIEDIYNTLGKEWRIHGQTYKTVPTETITHGPIELVLGVLKIKENKTVSHMEFYVSPIVKSIVDERLERFGVPSSELTARFDLCFCVAAAWYNGKFTIEEMQKPSYTNTHILALRNKIKLIADEKRLTFEGCSLIVYFTDGSSEKNNVDAFLGSPKNSMTDSQLSELFRETAQPYLKDKHISDILDSLWNLEKSPQINEIINLLKIH